MFSWTSFCTVVNLGFISYDVLLPNDVGPGVNTFNNWRNYLKEFAAQLFQ